MRSIFCIALAFLLLSVSCRKEDIKKGVYYLKEDFEGISSTDTLFPDDNSRWSYFQQTIAENSISMDASIPHWGNQCLRFDARHGNVLSKCDIGKDNLTFLQGEVVSFSAWYYLPGNQDVGALYLVDIEEDVPIGVAPGLRIALEGADGILMVDGSKMNGKNYRQEESSKIAFPRNQWTELKIEAKLEQKKTGYVKVWQNGVLVFDLNKIQTLPKDNLYFIQGSRGLYNSLQVGITATTSVEDVVLYMDDIEIQKKL